VPVPPGVESEVAAERRVSAGWVRRLKQRRRESRETAPRKQRHGLPPKRIAAEAIRTSVRKATEASLEEHRRRFGMDLGISTLWRAIDVLGLTLKKSPEGR
jgi:transposase